MTYTTTTTTTTTTTEGHDMKQLWAAYRTDAYNPFGGREFVGYVGWHTNATDALAEAIRCNEAGEYDPNPSRVAWGFAPIEYTPVDSSAITVSRA